VTEVEAFRDFRLGEDLPVRILIIDSDVDYIEIITTLLKRDNITIEYVKNTQEALKQVSSDNFDLIFLNIELNGLDDGTTLLGKIRESSLVPVIALNELNDETDSLDLIMEGADYDLQKPFTPRRLRAAVTAVLRRSEMSEAENTDPVLPEVLETGGLSLSLGRLEVTVNGVKASLSARAFSLLQFLMNNPDRTFTREELAVRAWGWAKNGEMQGEMRAIDSTIKRLRGKIERDSRNPRFILTERNIGYSFVSKPK